MLRRFRPRLSYANVIATVALFIALGGGAYAAVTAPKNSVTSRSIKNGQVKRVDLGARAVTNSKIGPNAVSSSKIADNAITSTKILDGAIATPKLADNAVTLNKLAANSVNGLTNIEDGTVTGADVLENTLKFGCAAPTVQSPNAGPFQIGTDGFCAFVMHPASPGRTWTQAATDCNGVVGDSTLATPAQIAQLQATNGGDQGPLTGITGIWTSSPSAITSVWTVHVGNGGTVTDFAQAAITTVDPSPFACVYQPASKTG
jgi:hypothetical protein